MFQRKAAGKLGALLFITCLIHSFIIATPAFAAELRVVDPIGLVRAATHIETHAVVVVKVKGTELPDQISLINVDGLTSAVSAKNNGGIYQFKAVAEGSWKIDAPESLAIVEVKIVQ